MSSFDMMNRFERGSDSKGKFSFEHFRSVQHYGISSLFIRAHSSFSICFTLFFYFFFIILFSGMCARHLLHSFYSSSGGKSFSILRSIFAMITIFFSHCLLQIGRLIFFKCYLHLQMHRDLFDELTIVINSLISEFLSGKIGSTQFHRIFVLLLFD